MNLAIYASLASDYSETFITMQMERLPCVFRIHGGPFPDETVPGGSIRPLRSVRGLLETAWLRGVKKTRWDGPQASELIRRLRRHRVDRVLANYGPGGVALLSVCRKLSIPLVVHFHGYDAHKEEVVAHHRENYRRLGREAAAVVVVSHGMAAAVAALGVPENKIHLTRCGVDPDCFTPKTSFPEKPLFFGIGRFVDKKAPYLTLLAFAQARKHLPDARLILGGTGTLWEATRNIASALHLDDAVEFPGILPPPAVAACMRQATAYVQHSLEPRVGPAAGDREGTPVAVLEAMITGLPVIATRHAGIGEVVEHERTGLLTEERDIDGMAAAMVRLGRSPDLAAALGAAARAEALAKYTADRYIDALKRILQSAG